MINLKLARIKRGYTREEISKICGVCVSTVSRWETGSITPPVQALIKLADLFNVSIDYLVGRKENESVNN